MVTPNAMAWRSFVLRIVLIVGGALGLRFLEWIFLPRPLPFLAPAILVGGGLYLLFIDQTSLPIRDGRFIKGVTGVGLIVLAFVLARPGKPEAVMPWQPYSDAALAAAKAAGKPVMIDFYADWCLQCRVLDRETFSRKVVVDAAKRVVTLRADLSDEGSPAAMRLAEKFAVFKFPTVVFIGSDGEERRNLRMHGGEMPAEFVLRLRSVP